MFRTDVLNTIYNLNTVDILEGLQELKKVKSDTEVFEGEFMTKKLMFSGTYLVEDNKWKGFVILRWKKQILWISQSDNMEYYKDSIYRLRLYNQPFYNTPLTWFEEKMKNPDFEKSKNFVFEGSYNDTQRGFDGPWKSYYPSGKPKVTKNYSYCKIEGEAIKYFENGKIEIEAIFKKG